MWPYFDPEYDNLSQQIYPPRVSIDNSSCPDSTLVKVDSMNKNGILLEVVQVLSDLDLTISKAYITSDGSWFMDVFHVNDQQGRKITDRKTIEYIEKALGPGSNKIGSKTVGTHSLGNHTAIELIGSDRPGLLSEVFAVLTTLHCNVIAAEMWTHKSRVACVVYVNDSTTSGAVEDSKRLSVIEHSLRNIMYGPQNTARGSLTNFSIGSTHVDRRLHQLMFADKDYENEGVDAEKKGDCFKPVVTVERCEEKGYSVVNVKCKDRPKLLFDIVCTLTDMQLAVSHAAVALDGEFALQELYIRQVDGCILDSEAEMEKVVKCLEAAICRRVCEGFSLELCGRDRVGLLSDVTRVLREYGLSVTRADVTTTGEQAMSVFYVSDASGNPIDIKTIDDLRQEIGHTMMLNVKRFPHNVMADPAAEAGTWARNCLSIRSLFRKLLFL